MVNVASAEWLSCCWFCVTGDDGSGVRDNGGAGGLCRFVARWRC